MALIRVCGLLGVDVASEEMYDWGEALRFQIVKSGPVSFAHLIPC